MADKVKHMMLVLVIDRSNNTDLAGLETEVEGPF